MPYRKTPFVTNEIYHIYNRGVAKLPTFYDKRDYDRFLRTIYYYQFDNPKPQLSQLKRFKNFNFEQNKKIVEIICYCLMPNHYHLLIRQLKENGISEFISKFSNSYTKYFNTRHDRVGPLLQGQFKASYIDSEEQLLHVSRYIHLNPSTSYLVRDLQQYPWSSYTSYISNSLDKICNKEVILSMFRSKAHYEQFVLDQANYAKTLKQIEQEILEKP